MRDGSVIVIVSDGVLNAYATPEAAVHAMARQLWDIRKARRNPAKREEAMPLLQAAKGDHAALKILREAEKAANERKPHDHDQVLESGLRFPKIPATILRAGHSDEPSHFSRDDMSVCVLLVEVRKNALGVFCL